MLNEEINKYKEMYTGVINAFVGLHNQHLAFLKTLGRDPGYATRRELKKIELLARSLRKQSHKVSKENMANIRLKKKQEREEKKNVKHRRTTKNPV